MDVKRAICADMPALVELAEPELDDEGADCGTARALDRWMRLVTQDISLNFDSETLFLQLPSAAATGDRGSGDAKRRCGAASPPVYSSTAAIGVPLDAQCPVGLLRMVRFLVLYDQMNQAIRNAQYRIHFRDFVGGVDLEGPDDAVRVAAFTALGARFGARRVRDRILREMTGLRSRAAKATGDADARRRHTRDLLVLARLRFIAKEAARA